MREFKGRVVTPGTAKAEAVVTHGGFNTLASLQKSLQFGDKTAKCNDQNNPDLYGKPLAGYALCLPQTIGSTTGGMVLYCACAMKRQPALCVFEMRFFEMGKDLLVSVFHLCYHMRKALYF